ncbi:hypothetical protein F5X98DRAFT_346687 [Xylaria grammica]|nr:hypothetical protein F5X98DRAFT_346687 [Xylaria grammica]
MDASGTPTLHPGRVSHGYLTYSIISGILTLISVVCVALRFFHRYRSQDFWWDDWNVMGALVAGIGVFILNILISLPSIGAAGYHVWEYTSDQLIIWAKIGLAADVLYNLSVSLSKISVVLFYKRIFSIDRQFRVFMVVTLFVIVGALLSSIFGLIFSYTPVAAQWDMSIPHTMIDTKPFYIIIAVVNISLDTAILGFAQLKVWGLHLNYKRKLLLSLVFLIGILTIISGILRVIYLETIDLSDPTYTLTTPGIWTNVELFLSIICASLPVVYSLFRISFARQGAGRLPSAVRTPKGSLVTFGSAPIKSTHNAHEQDSHLPVGHSRYEVICESELNGESHSMEPLDPVRIRTEYSVVH